MKEIVAKALAERVKDGETIGIGTGSTVDLALQAIGERVRSEGLRLSVVPTSYQSAWRCQELGLSVLYYGYNGMLSWGFDGADQVNSQRWAIKGKGGALLQEKILAARCQKFVLIVDDSKVVAKLGEGCPVPVEVIPEALAVVERELPKIGGRSWTMRSGSGKHGPIITERGNIILDVAFDVITETHEKQLKSILGVVESGLFTDYADEVLVAGKDGVRNL